MFRNNMRRQGITSVIAMLFLVIMGAMALGFYASTITSVQTSKNQRDNEEGLLAAESGMQFMKYCLSHVSVPSGTTTDGLDDAVFAALSAQLNRTNNLRGGDIAMVNGLIQIPAGANEYIAVNDHGAKFRVTLKQVDREMRVAVTGFSGGIARIGDGITMDFKIRQQRSPILDYGVAARGPLKLSGGIITGTPAGEGSIFTASTLANPLQMSGSTVISGTVTMSNPTGTINGSGNIGGQSNPAAWVPPLVTNNAPVPEFPAVNPSPFVNYLVGKETLITGNVSGPNLTNIRVKAGCNAQFSGGVINGVVLIEAPNQITFSGGCIVNGVVVVANPDEATSTNKLTFSGGSSIRGVESLPDVEPYKALRLLTGSSLLAPTFAVTMSGGSSSFGGAVVCKSMVGSGGSGGNVAGTVIMTGNSLLTLSGGSGFSITAGTSGIPTGVTFGGNFVARNETWAEHTLVNGACPIP